MKKPANWDSIQVPSGETYKQLPAGGYVCKIISASVDKTMSGAERLNIKFDISEGEYKNFFGEKALIYYGRMGEGSELQLKYLEQKKEVETLLKKINNSNTSTSSV